MIQVTGQGKVLYKTADNRLGRFPEAASEDLLAGPKRNFQVIDPLDFLAEVTQHIPDAGEHQIRYHDPECGVYSRRWDPKRTRNVIAPPTRHTAPTVGAEN